MFDPEATIQDADIEQAEMEREGARIDATKARGICTHGSIIGNIKGDPVYPIQRGLIGDQAACTDGCDLIFYDRDDWDGARMDAPNRNERELPEEWMMCVRYGAMCSTCGLERDPHMSEDDAAAYHLRNDPAHEAAWVPNTDKEYRR